MCCLPPGLVEDTGASPQAKALFILPHAARDYQVVFVGDLVGGFPVKGAGSRCGTGPVRQVETL